MRKTIIISLFIIKASSLYSQAEIKYNDIIKQRMLLREYALCKCLDYGFANDSLLKKDFSVAVLVEQLNYSPQAYFIIDSLMRNFADSIHSSRYIDALGKKGVMVNCIDYYNGRDLSLYIRRLDKYLHIK